MRRILMLFFIVVLPLFGAKNRYTLNLATSWDSANLENFTAYVSMLSSDTLKINIITPKKHKNEFGLFDEVKDGKIDLAYTDLSYYIDKDPKFSLFSHLPFGLNAEQIAEWIDFGGGEIYKRKLFDKYNLKAYNMGMAQVGVWFKKEINSLSDFNGLKIRSSGLNSKLYDSIGATMSIVSLSELFVAFNMGTIDAVEGISLANDMRSKFHSLASFYYINSGEPSLSFYLLANKNSLKKLPKELQNVVEISAKLADISMKKALKKENLEMLDFIKKNHADLQIRGFSEDINKNFKIKIDEILEENSKKDPLFREILNSQIKFLNLDKSLEKTKNGSYSKFDITSKVVKNEANTTDINKTKEK